MDQNFPWCAGGKDANEMKPSGLEYANLKFVKKIDHQRREDIETCFRYALRECVLAVENVENR